MNEVHLRVADGRRLSSEATQRLARLLDGEILPRLERPGRYVGWVSPRDLEAPPAQAPVHLVWPCPPEGPLSPPQLEPLRRALEARGIEISYGATPTPELIALLDRHDLGAFAHDRWNPLCAEDRWLVWMEEPGQLLDLLTLLHAARQPLRRADGGPCVILAGPACLEEFPLASVYADQIISSVDPEAIADLLASRPVEGRGVATRQREVPKRPIRSAPACDDEPTARCVGAGELKEPWCTIRLDREALRQTRLNVFAASEALRARLGLAESDALRAAATSALEVGSLELLFALGLPDERDADRAAIVRCVRELGELAQERRRRIQILLAFYRDSECPVEQLEAWAGEIVKQLKGFRVRAPRAASLLRDRRLLASKPADADWLESLFFDGMWSVESELAQSARVWSVATDEEQSPRPASISGIAPAPTGLGQGVREPRNAASTPADRWRRWSAMLPQQFDYRLEFARRGRLRHLSHRETGELLLRACHEAGIEVATAGIAQPRPKLAFGQSLAVGVEGLREFADLGLTRKCAHLKRLLERRLPAGLELASSRFVPGGVGRHGLNRVVEAEYEVAIPATLHDGLRTRLAAQKTFEQVQDIRFDEPTLSFVLDLRGEGKKLRPRDLIARLLDGLDADLELLKIQRTRLWAQVPGSDRKHAPMELVERFVNDLRARERACA